MCACARALVCVCVWQAGWGGRGAWGLAHARVGGGRRQRVTRASYMRFFFICFDIRVVFPKRVQFGYWVEILVSLVPLRVWVLLLAPPPLHFGCAQKCHCFLNHIMSS